MFDGRVGRNVRREEHAHVYAITHVAMDTKQGLGFFCADGRVLFAPPSHLFHFNRLGHESPDGAS